MLVLKCGQGFVRYKAAGVTKQECNKWSATRQRTRRSRLRGWTRRYFFYLVNRPVLVLKCDQGFVGYKAAGATKLECNKATYETIQVERADKGQVYFKGEWLLCGLP